jgi:hypothetical protein
VVVAVVDVVVVRAQAGWSPGGLVDTTPGISGASPGTRAARVQAGIRGAAARGSRAAAPGTPPPTPASGVSRCGSIASVRPSLSLSTDVGLTRFATSRRR